MTNALLWDWIKRILSRRNDLSAWLIFQPIVSFIPPYCKKKADRQAAILQAELENELFSPVIFPKHYLSDESGMTKPDIEAWLRTARFIRFNPTEIVDKRFSYRFQSEIMNMFTGRVTYKSGKRLRDEVLWLYNR